MSIEPVNAYRISNGKCYHDKSEAYVEEVKALFDKLQVIAASRPSFHPQVLEKKLRELDKWLSECDGVLSSIGGKHDPAVEEKIKAVREWYEAGKDIRKKIASDPELEAKMAQLG